MKSTDSKYSSDHITAQLQVSGLPAPPGCGGESNHSEKTNNRALDFDKGTHSKDYANTF